MLFQRKVPPSVTNLPEAGAGDFILKPFNFMGAEGPHQEISLNNKINGYVILYLHSSNRLIDHLEQNCGGMFMAVSSCNKAAKSHRRYPRTVQHIHSFTKKAPPQTDSQNITFLHKRFPVSTSSSSLKDCRRNTASSICRQVNNTPPPWPAKRALQQMTKIPPVAQGAQTAGIQPVTP